MSRPTVEVVPCRELERVVVLRIVFWLLALILTIALIACDTQDPDVVAGEAIVKGTCKVCHAQGINGAPIIGNHKMWRGRAEQGLDVLVQHASNGYELMPARGGNESLTDEQIRQAIKFMLAQLEEKK